MFKYAIIFFLFSISMLSCKKESIEPYGTWLDIHETYISSMSLDRDGALWMSSYTDTASVIKYDKGVVSYHDSLNSPLSSANFKLVRNDEEKKVWLGKGLVISHSSGIRQGYKAGFSFWTTSATNLKHKLQKYQVDAAGNVWDADYAARSYPSGGGTLGIRMFDGKSWHVYNQQNSGLPNNHVMGICFDKNGSLLACTMPYSGQRGVVVRFDGQQFKTIYESKDNSYWVASMVVDKSGTIWLAELTRDRIGVEYGGGLISINGNTVTRYTIENSGLPSNSVVDLWLDEKENLWIGTYGGGMAKFDRGKKWKVFNSENTRIPSTNSIEHICTDSQNNVWAAIWQKGVVMMH